VWNLSTGAPSALGTPTSLVSRRQFAPPGQAAQAAIDIDVPTLLALLVLDIEVTSSGEAVPVGLGFFCLDLIEAQVTWSEMPNTTMTVRTELRDGEHRITRLAIADDRGLTSSSLRQVPLRALAEVVVREVTATTAMRTTWGATPGTPTAARIAGILAEPDSFRGLQLRVPDEGKFNVAGWFRQGEFRKDLDKSQGPTADVLEHIAAIYRVARVLGVAPTLAVQTEMDLPRSTATRWLALAREQGHLGSEEIGRAGGRPGRLGGQQ
jgi:hypothetical protein